MVMSHGYTWFGKSLQVLDNLWKMNIVITMDIDPDLLDQIPLPQELLEQTPEPVLVFLMQLLAENQLLRARIVQLEAENQALLARIEQLEARLNQNSSNSNKPPSSDSRSRPKRKRPPRLKKGPDAGARASASSAFAR